MNPPPACGAGARRPMRSVPAAVLLTLALGACSATTYDASVTTIAADQTTTTTLPEGPAAELLARLVADAGELSGRIVEGDDQDLVLERIEALWAASRDQVAVEHPELLDAFDRSIAMCRTAVERRRPADADKATKNLEVLVASTSPA